MWSWSPLSSLISYEHACLNDVQLFFFLIILSSFFCFLFWICLFSWLVVLNMMYSVSLFLLVFIALGPHEKACPAACHLRTEKSPLQIIKSHKNIISSVGRSRGGRWCAGGVWSHLKVAIICCANLGGRVWFNKTWYNFHGAHVAIFDSCCYEVKKMK